MNEDFISNFQLTLRPIDMLDIGIIAFIMYRVLVLLRGTRAMQMLTGLIVLGLAFVLAQYIELFTTNWLFSHFFNLLPFIVIVVFQDDIRRALTHVGKNPFFGGTSFEEEKQMVDEIAKAAAQLARERVGAIIAIARETGLKNFVDTGSQLEAKVKAELLYSIFLPKSPIHDGAVIIQDGRISAAGCFLPLSKEPDIDKRYGSRHRAALGLTEDSDAIVVLISEEAGEVHLVKNGKITMNLNESELRQSLSALLDLSRGEVAVPKRMRGWFGQGRRD